MGLSVVSLVLLGLASVGWVASVWDLLALLRIRRRALTEPKRWPSFSILKPVAGVDDELLENLQSHLKLDYPGDWELLIGLRSVHDAAFPIVDAFAAANPGRVRVHLQEGAPGFNPKVNQLITLTRHAKGEVIALTDSDIRVPATFLREHACRLSEPGVGLSSSLFVGAGEKSLGSTFDNMTVNSFCAPSCAAAEVTLNMTQIVGKAMAVRRTTLDELGGWEVVKDLLAEDQRFGVMLRQTGLKSRLTPTPVQNIHRTHPFSGYWERHCRWAMIRFKLLPAVWFEPMLNATLCSFLAALSSPLSLFAWEVFGAAAVFSIVTTQLATRALRGYPFAVKWSWLIPLRDLVSFLIWLRGMTMHSVNWRGNSLLVLKGTQLRGLKK